MTFNRAQLEKYLRIITHKLYVRYEFLRTDSLENLTNKVLNRYLDSGMTTDQINRDLSDIVEKKREEYERMKKAQSDIAKEKHYDLNDLFDCRVSNGCLHIHVVPKSVKDDMSQAGGPTRYLNDVVSPKLDDALNKVIDILNTSEKDIPTVAAISPTLRLAQNLFRERGFDVGETNNETFVNMFGDSKIFMATIPRDKLIEFYTKKKEEEKPIEFKDELSDMMYDHDNTITNMKRISDKEKPKKLTKKNNNESGSIGVFSIVLAMLVITGMVLIAMILNVVLK